MIKVKIKRTIELLNTKLEISIHGEYNEKSLCNDSIENFCVMTKKTTKEVNKISLSYDEDITFLFCKEDLEIFKAELVLLAIT